LLFNESPGREANTFTDILVSRAETHADRRAYVFLRDGEDEEATLTFGELHQRALAVAERLMSLGGPGERALLLYPSGLDFIASFFGCLYAGVVPVPVSVPSRSRGFEIVRGIAADTGARWILSTTSLLTKFEKALTDDATLGRLPRFGTDEWPSSPLAQPALPARSASDIALLQYTSGSTESPRGVIVTHANLIDNQRQVQHSFRNDADTVYLSWLPMFHDMGLGTVLQTLWLGVPCVLMSPSAFLQKPSRWLQAISRYHATSSGGPDFAYDLCVRRISEAERAGLDLSSWYIAYNGSEPVRPVTLERFAAAFAPCGFKREAFHPVYGLAEATVFVSGEDPRDAPVVRKFSTSSLELGEGVLAGSSKGHDLVSCGHAWLEGRFLIIDPATREACAYGQIGEIWVGGPSVAAGYWNKPEETTATFDAHTADGDGPFLRTGDLGFVHDGHLFITGRLKDLIIIRGLNHYPQDIESTVASCHPALEGQGCAAFSIESDDGEQLVVVQEVKRSALHGLDSEAVFRAIRNVVSEGHGLHTHAIVLLRPASLPRTTSGKVRRKVCRQAFLEQTLAEVASSVFGVEVINQGGESQPRIDVAVKPRAAQGSASKTDVIATRATEARARKAAERVIDWLRRYSDTSAENHNDDVLRTLSPSLLQEFGAQGLLALQVSPQYGGLELGHSETARVLEQLAAIDMNAGLFVGLNNYLGIGPIARHATASVKATLLPRLSRGTQLAGFAFAEPANGTGAEALASYAEPVNGSGWKLYGKKYASGGPSTGVMNVFVRHRDQSSITAFVVPQGTTGLTHASSAVTHSTQSLARGRVVLDGAYVQHEHVLGRVGDGMQIAAESMAHAHLAVAAACLGGMKRCAQLVFHYATQRQTSTGRLVAHPVTLAKLGRVTAGVTALECLVQQVAAALDGGPGVPSEAFTVCKVVAPEMLWQVVDDLVQLLGRRGYVETPHIRNLVRDAQALRSCEGPTEVMSALLGARLMSEGDDGIVQLITDVLRAPDVVPLVERSLGALRARVRQRAAGTAEGIYWEQARAGELATWLALLAAVEGRRKTGTTGELERATTWCRANFERTLASVESERLATGVREDEAISESVTAYSRSVGHIDPLLVWGERAIHPSVAVDALPPSSERPSVPAAPAAALPREQRQSLEPSRQELTAWVVRWLSVRLRIAEDQVDSQRSFADHGLDSLAAVEFAKALSDHLGRPLDETLLWNFATIGALVDHLESSATIPDTARSAGPGTGPQTKPESSEGSDLEDEIARLERELRRR
jgi:acyl-CoA synthetase (AMP-forming)/AMP-acid ligase II/alkylation response protein AidB-like acyl-CoA dehydrogenase/acyl carrier protein